MKSISFDSVGGASGDMLLATLIDLGANFERLSELIQTITPEPLTIERTAASDSGLHGTRLAITVQAPTEWIAPHEPTTPTLVDHAPRTHDDHAPHIHDDHAPHTHGDHSPHSHDDHAPHTHDDHAPHTHDDHKHSAAATKHTHAPHRGLSEILTILEHPAIPARTRLLATATFRRLAEAEARIHNTTLEAIHFHEVGAADAIADIVGCCYALELLDVGAIRIGPLPAGCGTFHCAHGEMPNPAPATQLLLQGMTVIQTDEPFELVTPTGAALLATWQHELAASPAQGRIVSSGMGFGTRKLNRRPNVLRATLLDNAASAAPSTDESLIVLETNLDDCNPQWIGELIGRLLEGGALDAWATPITMKKGRLALMLSVLCRPESAPQLQRTIFLATPTFGIRTYPVNRTALARRFETVETPYGAVRVKIGELDGQVITRMPEFDDCNERARAAGVTPRQVAEAAR